MMNDFADRIAAFERGRDARSADVFERNADLVHDHRGPHPWLTGALGDPFAGVWFVAENPSLTQVERVRDCTPNSQWLQSRGDKLFRQMLVEHGFKDAPAEGPGGWHCYITDVVKSADRAGAWAKLPKAEQMATAEAWAPVLAWELEHSKPKLLVCVGKQAGRFLDALAAGGHLPQLPERTSVDHYSFVAMRPLGELGPMHPERVAAYGEQFAAVAHRLETLNQT